VLVSAGTCEEDARKLIAKMIIALTPPKKLNAKEHGDVFF
jgi:hypothetical protein